MVSTTFWIQLLGVGFGVAMLYFTFVKYKRKEISNVESTGWVTLWVILVSVAIIPSILDPIIEPLNFHRRLDFFVVLGFFALLGLGFYNYSLVRNLERKMEIFVRKEALRHHKK